MSDKNSTKVQKTELPAGRLKRLVGRRETTNRKDRPVDRIRAVMRRLSRDRYLTGGEVVMISRKLARLASPGRYYTVINNAFARECDCIGMIDGYPPAFVFEKRHAFFFEAMKGRKPDNDGTNELLLLNTLIRSMKYE